MTLSEMLKFYNEKATQLNLPTRRAAFRTKEQAISALSEVGISYTEDTAETQAEAARLKAEAKAEAARLKAEAPPVAEEPKPKKKAVKKVKKVKAKKAKKKTASKEVERNANAFRGHREIILQKLLAAKGKSIAFSVLAKAINGNSGAVSLAIRGMELRMVKVMPGYKFVREKKGKETQIALQTSKRSTV